MPRPGPRRQQKTIRLLATEIAAIQSVADRDGLEWSEAARTLITYALLDMPEGWRGERG